ncbi:MAG TPA: ORF6N domain-containing protein [Bryobacteraceae bacterium]|nr:ORF6N domain-containing protein [Bryobacteraceae bacterium]
MPKKILPSDQLVPMALIERRILLIRAHKVMLDRHLAEIYEVPTFRLNEAVKRNRQRFPEDFMFQLSRKEAAFLTSQTAMSKPVRGGRRTLPYVFTEQGVAMLSTVLKSERAIAVNIAIMRAFVRLRQILATHKDLAERLDAMEKKCDKQFKTVFEVLRQLMERPPQPSKRPIGFVGPATP